MSDIHGKCMCEAVEFTFSTKSLLAYQCHCSICRKATGSAYSTTLMIPVADFRWLRGEDKVSSYSAESGYTAGFCSCCGASVPNKFRDYPLYNVPVGSLEGAPEIQVVAQIYLSSRADWDREALEGRRFDEMPSLAAMFKLLHLER